MKIVFNTTPLPPIERIPPHPHYQLTDEFITRHDMEIDEAETWVELRKHGHKHRLNYNKDTGLLVLYHEGESILFKGYLPDEAALEQIILYTNW